MDFVRKKMESVLSPFENAEKEEDLWHVSDSTKEAGYETSNPIYNTVDAQVFLTIIVAIIPILNFLNCIFKKFARVTKTINTIKSQLFWNAFIRLFIEEY